MRICIQTLGSRGDVQPMVALGKGLRLAGHDVTLCTSSSFESFVKSHGLRYAYMNNDLVDVIHSPDGKALMENVDGVVPALRAYWKMKKAITPINRRIVSDSWDAVKEANPDIILFHPKAFACPDFAENLGAPCAMTLLQPFFAPTREFPCPGFPSWSLGGAYNRLTYHLTRKLTELATRKYANEWRAENGLPRRPRGTGVVRTSSGKPIPVLHGFSPHVVPKPADWPGYAVQTGYWFLDAADDWTPPAELEAFLGSGPPPVSIGFGSMSGRNPERITSIVLEAVRLAGVRAVLITGWGGLSAADIPESVFKLEQAPYDWLFPRMAAVVHHGGAGTTASSLRAGRPTVVCPFIVDQFFWGQRVQALGAGPRAIPQKQLTAENLAEALKEATGDKSIAANAQRIGQLIRSEDGIATARTVIERLCGS